MAGTPFLDHRGFRILLPGEGLLVAAAVTLLAGLWRGNERRRRQARPGTIVIDETAGRFLALAFVPLDFGWYLAGFILFRAADILKPWPASWARSGHPRRLGNYDGRHLCRTLSDGATLRCSDLPDGPSRE